MKLELIWDNLNLCAREAEAGKQQAAVDAAYMTARLLLTQTAAEQSGRMLSEEELRKTAIALMGVAGAVQQQLEILTPGLKTASLIPQLQSRILQVQETFADAEKDYSELAAKNQELLDQEEALRAKKKELEELKKKLAELIEIKTENLKKLQEDVENQKKALAALEHEYSQYEKIYSAVAAELQENAAIIQALPDSVGIQSADDLIAHAKQQREAMEQAGQTSSTWIRDILEEIHRVQKLAAGPEQH